MGMMMKGGNEHEKVGIGIGCGHISLVRAES